MFSKKGRNIYMIYEGLVHLATTKVDRSAIEVFFHNDILVILRTYIPPAFYYYNFNKYFDHTQMLSFRHY